MRQLSLFTAVTYTVALNLCRRAVSFLADLLIVHAQLGLFFLSSLFFFPFPQDRVHAFRRLLLPKMRTHRRLTHSQTDLFLLLRDRRTLGATLVRLHVTRCFVKKIDWLTHSQNVTFSGPRSGLREKGERDKKTTAPHNCPLILQLRTDVDESFVVCLPGAGGAHRPSIAGLLPSPRRCTAFDSTTMYLVRVSCLLFLFYRASSTRSLPSVWVSSASLAKRCAGSSSWRTGFLV